MKIACLAFTRSGEAIAKRIKCCSDYEVHKFSKENYKINLNNIFSDYDGIVFISSTGIAIRISAPFIKNKSVDPAIVVVDDLGRYSISLLSGHIGGANYLAENIAGCLKNQPIITTASDGRGIEAVDMFAKRNNLFIESFGNAKQITSMMIDGDNIKIESEIEAKIGYRNIVENNESGAIFVSSKQSINYDKPSCILRPKNIIVGLGCRRGKSMDEIISALTEVFKSNDLSIKCIKAIATVDVKQDEIGIIDACKNLNCEMVIISREDIKVVQDKFNKSAFVESTIGVSSVCEPCAYISGGELIVRRTAINGITIAISKGGM
ncbi:cobalt-precorrin 5A hydrolase [Clostridium bowmanii]|uniref:cobalt-precorrin 5A hydrolase n=1 Tax=Clostridium bowmanii TaxID=132925 RepID=UPI001C0AB783|nr:cobalt-precorrin 5A hydrolase [Clostridium bowmanii]MBU3190239.1 cobalt-precorrin 5A hydrolase [Clostridium bowmanii]MCA1074786.1 cobalt-precorrin 5A hydrolase [Clostridium bowmanii]